MSVKPERRPANPNFSSGPCAKRPGWRLDALNTNLLGRSHRAKPAKARIQEVIARSRAILGVPADYLCGLVPASDTGAVEMALWSLLGALPVDMFAWESFGKEWVTDVQKQLKLRDCRTFIADYGQLPDLMAADWQHDVVFPWNGTTSGVRVPDGEWIAANRHGLAICDATSAVFAMHIPWDKLDVVTWSWQKVLGGEGGHGMLVLSPRAVARLESYTPDRPLPKIFRMTKGGKVDRSIFEGSTINTPSMLCVEDAVDGLQWAEHIGGLEVLIARSQQNLATVTAWEANSSWAGFLAERPEIRSNTSICLQITDPAYQGLSATEQATKAKALADLLDKEGAAYDIGAYRDAPPGLRIWGGATVEQSDMAALLPWLDWAYGQVMS
ncbi:MAG: phosphoserine transaminase [Caldilineaceae bacterium]|nr:phosphoserine transaminase [Caldilineaceae bacterium]